MTVLTDRRRPVDIIRARFLFNRRNALALFAVVMLRLIWVSCITLHAHSAGRQVTGD